mmetsp:Transcript_889/g.2498  ORF Transcript_889/g.2498 Transcript_889/m.2498 type:complete len:246 (+) Transcript_889:116-853(+)
MPLDLESLQVYLVGIPTGRSRYQNIRKNSYLPPTPLFPMPARLLVPPLDLALWEEEEEAAAAAAALSILSHSWSICVFASEPIGLPLAPSLLALASRLCFFPSDDPFFQPIFWSIWLPMFESPKASEGITAAVAATALALSRFGPKSAEADEITVPGLDSVDTINGAAPPRLKSVPYIDRRSLARSRYSSEGLLLFSGRVHVGLGASAASFSFFARFCLCRADDCSCLCSASMLANFLRHKRQIG